MDTKQARRIFDADPRIVEIRAYGSGFVANAYRWPCVREGCRFVRRNGRMRRIPIEYDAKRPYGQGPRWVAFSAKGGRLASK
jgi:hypothetical protein